MANKELVLTEQREKVRILTLNRPERLNALSIPLMTSLNNALQAANADPETNVIVLRGKGSSFCAGKDLKDHHQTGKDRDAVRTEITLLHEVTREILFGEKLVIAGVHGWAVGGGLELMINCDLVILEENARMFFPEMSLGLFVTCAVTALLPRMIGLSQSKSLILSGDRFDAQRARELGLAWKVFTGEEFDEKLIENALNLAGMPQVSLRQLKKVITNGMRDELEAALTVEAEIAGRAALDSGSHELIDAKFPTNPAS